MPILERSNPLPLYYQLKEVLKQQIRAGHLAPHTAIPSEPELVTQYHVSRATVRQALTELVHEGLLYRQHGRGTFVCEPRVQQQTISELTSFSEELRRRGKRPGGMLFISELVRGSQTVREQLRLTDEEQVIRLERLRTADDAPVAYEVDYLPYPRAAGVYQRAKEIADGSLYNLMASEGLQPYIAEQSIKADSASAREAELLRVSEKEAGLRLFCTAFDETGAQLSIPRPFFQQVCMNFA
ncbi:HTH-type transcriptional repressor YvoA [Dictyobacter vulcani]|uniref:HTH-type transcriptional repressor YvoA n=1 Tax=Dictyobacter vulcani TaxID=2607529 RepID=A0A5J4KN59_9CHLR|nr:GntR family transcriptional regulator [Dictyobacter vulcani]GER89295.1 HTH-type transcriptional repressor YvoA [Dictyobacter vulcani]